MFQRLLTVLVAGILSCAANATDTTFRLPGDIDGSIHGVLSFGTQIRLESPSPEAYGDWPSRVVRGVPTGYLIGQHGGSNLNFEAGDQISTVLKGAIDLDLHRGAAGILVRSNLWKDFALGEQDVRYGNFPNRFTPDSPLADRGFEDSAQFSSAELRDAYFYNSFKLGPAQTLDVRIGRQTMQWGETLLLPSGLNAAINPADYPSQFRPGALPTDRMLPVGRASFKWAEGQIWSFEGFADFEFRRTVLPACGTYFDTASFAPHGCNFGGVPGASERQLLALGSYIRRRADVDANDIGGFGFALGAHSKLLNTDFKLYGLHTPATMPTFRVTMESTTPGPLAASYAPLYPEDLPLVGLSFKHAFNPGAKLFGEVAYRPDQPLTLNVFDMFAGFANRNPLSILALRKNILGIPVGGTFDGYDRYGVVTGSLGATAVIPGLFRAERAIFALEAGFSHVNDLPAPTLIRYWRPPQYGGAAYAGPGGALTPCVDPPGLAGRSCSTEGYISDSAVGLRAQASASYPGALLGATVIPSLLVTADLDGFAFDGSLSEGRTMLRPALKAEWSQQYFLELSANVFCGGDYNLIVDRDYLSLVAGLSF